MKRVAIPRSVVPIVRQVVALVQPQRILLFGSGCRGRMHPGSDLDFLVVVPDNTSTTQVLDVLNTHVRRSKHPCDFLVTTAATLHRHRRNPGLVYGQILKEAVEVYAR